MVQEISTSISDMVLAAASYHAAYKLHGENLSAQVGFALIAMAATVGVVRFWQDQPSSTTVWLHELLSWLGGAVGTPCIAAGFYRKETIPYMANAHIASAMAIVIASRFLSKKVLGVAYEMVSTAAIVSILGLCLKKFNPFGVIGAVLYAVAGLAIGVEGKRFGVPNIDLFHYLLTLANIALLMGLTKQEQLVYYRGKY